MSPNNVDGMANSVDPDQTAPLGVVLFIKRRVFSCFYLDICYEKNKMHNIECQNHKTVHLERQTGWTTLGAVWSGSALFAQTYLSENLGSLWY